ncbi:SCO family protein [Sporosarcina limicola]|uniref:Protein SCO1/2 n=1 Tax=Sporosarcina limicola TaxID=34101 RepID=A0A927MGN8_9BACL|nr:SCO family protein [Sporosarcina limicola]MBE1554255.1 protein SCO1/2 [Sporosarcina limicola]
MKKIQTILFVLVCLSLLSACGAKTQTGTEITPFTFTNQEGQPFGTEELKGSIWIADFIFTQCETVCPPMTIEMASLQKKFKDEGIQAEFVSFTVDPTVDTPTLLKDYLKQYTDDDSNWHLLTGYTQEAIELFAREQFQTIVQKPATSNQVLHGTNFYLIDQQGFKIKEYNFVDTSYVEDLMKDIKKLQK